MSGSIYLIIQNNLPKSTGRQLNVWAMIGQPVWMVQFILLFELLFMLTRFQRMCCCCNAKLDSFMFCWEKQACT